MAQPDMNALNEHLEQVSRQVALVPNMSGNQDILTALRDIRNDVSTISEAQVQLQSKISEMSETLSRLLGGQHERSDNNPRPARHNAGMIELAMTPRVSVEEIL